MHKPNIQSSNRESLKRDFESIHLATWTKDDSYNFILVNAKDGETPSSILVYNVVIRKLMYEEKDLKGEMVNIYQKPQALINYLLDTFSNEGDWVLDLFLGSGKNYDLIFMKSYFNLILFLIYVFLQYLTSLFILYLVIRYNISMFPTERKELHSH
jgi:hypothetical protein